MNDETKPAHEIVLVTSDDSEMTEECKKVRVAVFADEQGFPLDTEIDEYDEPGQSVHLLLRLLPSKQTIGCVRIVLAKGKVGRLCVLKGYRQYGFGRDLMEKLHEVAISKYGIKRFELNSQMPVVRFYAKYGYEPVGDEFDEEGAPHQKMIKTID